MRDYHLHTPFCRHAAGCMEQYVEAAIAAGLEEICFTPHIPLPGFPRGPSGLRMEPEDVERYFRELERLQGRYRELSILGGIEADFYEGYERYVEEFLRRHPLDLVLMSVHFLRDWPEDNWVFDFSGLGKPLRQAYHEYFEALKRGIRTGLFDGLAHLDLIKQPGHPVLDTNAEDVAQVLELAARAGMCLEINTSGLRRALAEPYPALAILPLAAAAEVPLIAGSDAHEPLLVGYGFDTVRDWIAEVPGLECVRYRRRKGEPDRRSLAAGVAS
jgi:histidinol-phosphatase (PHP family)